MILHRVIEHVRKQEWTAIAIEALRLRKAQLIGRVYDLDFPLRTFGMYTLFGEEATP